MKNRKIQLIAFLSIHSSIIDLYFLSSNNANLYVQMLSNILLLIILIKELPILCTKYKRLNFILLLFSLSYLYSTYNVWHMEINFKLMSPYTSILQFLKVASLILTIEYINIKNKGILYLKTCLIILSGYVFISDVCIFLGIKSSASWMDFYPIGDKFIVSYQNLFLLSLYTQYKWLKYSKFNLKEYRLLAFIAMLIAWKVECSTAIMISLFMILISFIPKVYSIIKKPSIFCFSILVFDIGFYLFYNILLSSDIAKYIIVDVLGEDLTLTTRTFIWEALATILNKQPIWGFGPANETFVVSNLLDLTNAQNGLIHIYLGVGIIGVSLYLILLFNIVAKSKYDSIIFIFLYGLIIASIVEVTLETNFLCYASFLLINKTNNQILHNHETKY